MRVKVFICPKCQSGVYSRAAKDFSTCTCHALGVAGGPEAPKLSIGSSAAPKVKVVEVNLKASAEALEGDWSSMEDQFGRFAKGDGKLSGARPIKPNELNEYFTTRAPAPGEGAEGEEEGEDEDEEAGEGAAEETREEE